MTTLIVTATIAIHLYQHLAWYIAYTTDSGDLAAQERGPLIINLMLLLPVLSMWIVSIRNKTVSNLSLYGSFICMLLLVGGIYIGTTHSDPVGAGMTMLLLAMPAAIVITILAAMELQPTMTSK